MAKAVCKRRPCRICHHWFTPNPRVKGRQMTCANPRCKREWHRRKCAQWNRKNLEYFKANYLQKKIEAVTQPDQGSPIVRSESSSIPPPGRSRFSTGLPLQQFQEEIGAKFIVIVEYFVQVLIRRFQERLVEHKVEQIRGK